MIVEHALLRIRDGEAAAFEQAMRSAVPLIAESPGFREIEVRPAVEAPGFYLGLMEIARFETLLVRCLRSAVANVHEVPWHL